MLISENKGLYSKVSAKSISSSRDYLANAYGSRPVLYYNQPTQEEAKDKKGKKAKYIALIVSTALVSASIALSLLNHNKVIDMKYLEELSKKTGDRLSSIKLKEKIMNFMANFTNIKDDGWDRFSNFLSDIKFLKIHPFKFVSDIGRKMTNFYHSLAPKAYINDWNAKKLKVIELANKEGVKMDIPDFEALYCDTVSQMNEALHKRGNRITDGLLNKDIIKKITSSNIADTKITDVAKEALSEIKPEVKMSAELQNALSELNEYKIQSFKKLIPKIRDICAGSAPTDFLTWLISLGSLGVVVKNTKDKEEKESVIVNLGIPLMTTLSFTTIALLKSISGGTAFALGLITGEIASYGAKGISLLNKKHNQRTYEKIKAQVLEEQGAV